MNSRPLIVVAVLLWSSSLSRGQIGVQAGNSAGLSPASLAEELGIPRPPDPGGINAMRINRSAVKISLDGIQPGGDWVRLMRATGTGDWSMVMAWQSASVPTEFIDFAAAGQNYKYLAQSQQTVPQTGITTSRPTGVAYVSDVSATATAGEWSYIVPPFWEPAVGSLAIEGFYPSESPETPTTIEPNPFVLGGPFAQTVSKVGFITTREMLFAGAHVETTFFIPEAFASLYPIDHPWTGLLTAGVHSDGSGEPGLIDVFDLATDFGVYESRWTGDSSQGYDGASNPHWQMIPENAEPRLVSVDIAPAIGEHAFWLESLGIDIDDFFTGARLQSVQPGATPITLTHDSSTIFGGGGPLLPAGLRVPLNLDVRPRVDLKIKVVRLHMRYRKNGVETLSNLLLVPDPNTVALATELNLTFGQQANVYFTVDKQTVIHDDDDDSSLTDEDTDGIPGFETQGFTCPGSDWYTSLADSNRKDHGYIFTIFCSEFAKSPRHANGRPELVLGGQANSLSADAASHAVITILASDLGTYAHEVGHLLGLSHPWISSDRYSETNLPDDARSRIMAYDRTGRRLVKPERDVIHAQVTAISQSPPP